MGFALGQKLATDARVFRRYLRTRYGLFAVALGLTCGHRCALTRPPSRELNALAAFLGTEVGDAAKPVQVSPESIQWEPSRGPFGDLVWGRRVLFLATTGGGLNDVYRAKVRVAPDGSALQVNQWRNLTQTPLGDEGSLVVNDGAALFGTTAYGELQGITVLTLDGSSDLAEGSWLNRALLSLRAFQEVGDLAGVGRSHVTLAPIGTTELVVGHDRLSITPDQTQKTEVVQLSRDNGEFPRNYVRSVSQQHYGGQYWLHTLVDVVREGVGPAPLEWIERNVFQFGDWLKQRQHTSLGPDVVARAIDPKPEDGGKVSVWPPANLEPLLTPSEGGEGVWRPSGYHLAAGAEFTQSPDDPPFAQTWLRPDAQRPYSRLHLVALDMRRLSLGMEAGYEEPKPKTGPPGRGALTADKNLRERVVATFSGAFKSVHGDYGMMVDGRILVPPQPAAASVVVRRDGWVGLGTWPESTNIPDNVIAFRQNLDPLVANGVANPTQRDEWGLKLAGGSVVTERSALCRTASGNLYYAWGHELTGESLALGLVASGCDYAVHLDMNPGHAGFVYTSIKGTDSAGVSGELAVPEMSIHPREHAVWSDKDFFYLTQSEAGHSLSEQGGHVSWAPSPGGQPPPENWPAIWQGTTLLGALPIQLTRVEPGRTDHAVTASSMELMLTGRPTPRRDLPEGALKRVVMALTLGHSVSTARYGLAYGSRETLPLQTSQGGVVVTAEGGLQIVPEGELPPLVEGQGIAQLPVLLSNGVVTPHASLRGGKQSRGAICMLEGRLWVATVDNDSSDALAVTLRDIGCTTVLELDRGSKHAVSVVRENFEPLLEQDNDSTVLWVLGKPMQPRTFSFE